MINFKKYKNWMNESNSGKITVLFPGSFKPMHIGHVELIQRYVELPDVKEIKILIGPGVRNGITQEDAVNIANILLKDISKVSIEAVSHPTPITTAYKFMETAPAGIYTLAASSKEKENLDRIKKFVENHKNGRYVLPEGVDVTFTSVNTDPLYYENRTDDLNGQPISGTTLRNDVLNNDFYNFETNYPGISEYQTRELWKILKPIIKESLNEKFTTDSDPIRDLGIGIFSRKTFNSEQEAIDYIWEVLPAILDGKIPDDIILNNTDTGFFSKNKYFNKIKKYVEKYVDFEFDLRYHGYWEVFNALHNALIKAGYPLGKKYVEEFKLNHYTSKLTLQVSDSLISIHKFKKRKPKTFLKEKFEENSDPVKDLGIGIEHQLLKWIDNYNKTKGVYRGILLKLDKHNLLRLEELLCLCIENVEYEFVVYLLHLGADSDGKHMVAYVGAPLRYAVMYSKKSSDKSLKIVKALIKAGANPNNLNIGVFTGWENFTTPEIVNYLHEEIKKWNKKHTVSEKFVEDSDPVKDLGIGLEKKLEKWCVENGCRHFYVFKDYDEILLNLAQNKQYELAEYVATAYPKTLIGRWSPYAALRTALSSNDVPMAKLLIKCGSNYKEALNGWSMIASSGIYDFDENTKEYIHTLLNESLNEGGSAIPQSRSLTKDELINTFNYAIKTASQIFNVNSEVFKPVGSYGKKLEGQTYGDVDVLVDENAIRADENVLDYVANKFKEEGYTVSISRGFNQVSVGFPIEGDKSKGIAQVDFMLSKHPEWGEFSHYASDLSKGESKYKGIYASLLLMAIITESFKETTKVDENGDVEEYTFISYRLHDGLYRVTKTHKGAKGRIKVAKIVKEEFLSADPKEAIYLAFGEDISISDARNFEKTWNFIHKPNYIHKDKLTQIISKYKHYLDSSKVEYPKELKKEVNESINEKFTVDSDPIKDLGIGSNAYYTRLAKEIGKMNPLEFQEKYPYSIPADNIIVGGLVWQTIKCLGQMENNTSYEEAFVAAYINMKQYYTIDPLSMRAAIEILSKYFDIKIDLNRLDSDIPLKESLNEADERKINVHMQHLEELLFEGNSGLDFISYTINNLYKKLTNQTSDIVVSVKIDGAPTMMAWSKFPGLKPSGVGIKTVFNKVPVSAHSIPEVNKVYGDRPDLAEKLKGLLQYVVQLQIPENEIWQGDFLFDSKTLKQEGNNLTFRPNTIKYSVDKDSEIGQKILNSDFGIIWHTRYVGENISSAKSMFNIDISKLNYPEGIYMSEPYLTEIDLTKLEEFVAQNEKLEAEIENINDKLQQLKGEQYENFLSYKTFKALFLKFHNSIIKSGKSLDDRMFIDQFINFVKKEKTPAVATKINEFVKANIDVIDLIIELTLSLMIVKKEFLMRLNKLETFKASVELTSGKSKNINQEGFAVSSPDGNIVKIIDREEFSYLNFSPDVVKGWQK